MGNGMFGESGTCSAEMGESYINYIATDAELDQERSQAV
jgi:hypothetical protein